MGSRLRIEEIIMLSNIHGANMDIIKESARLVRFWITTSANTANPTVEKYFLVSVSDR
jgi:hypothetical protein